MSWYRRRRQEREQDYRAKRRQKNLLTTAGVLGVAGGLARAPWAAKHAVRAAGKVSPRVGRGVARVPAGARTRLRDVERAATSASTPLAIGSGAVGSASSLTYAGRLKRETKKEGKKLGLEKSAPRGSLKALRTGYVRSMPRTVRSGARSAPGPARSADVAQGKKIRDQRLAQYARERRLSQIGKAAPPPSDEARRRSYNAANDDWRSHVSSGAVAAHDKVLPVYRRRHAQNSTRNVLGSFAAGSGAVASGVGALKARRMPLKALGAAGAGGLGTASVLGMKRGAEANERRLGIEESRRKIRARGHQRSLDAVR